MQAAITLGAGPLLAWLLFDGVLQGSRLGRRNSSVLEIVRTPVPSPHTSQLDAYMQRYQQAGVQVPAHAHLVARLLVGMPDHMISLQKMPVLSLSSAAVDLAAPAPDDVLVTKVHCLDGL